MANVEEIIIAKRRRHTVARSNFGFGYLRDRWNERAEKAFANLPIRCLLNHPTKMIQLYCCSFGRGDKIRCDQGRVGRLWAICGCPCHDKRFQLPIQIQSNTRSFQQSFILGFSVFLPVPTTNDFFSWQRTPLVSTQCCLCCS